MIFHATSALPSPQTLPGIIRPQRNRFPRFKRADVKNPVTRTVGFILVASTDPGERSSLKRSRSGKQLTDRSSGR